MHISESAYVNILFKLKGPTTLVLLDPLRSLFIYLNNPSKICLGTCITCMPKEGGPCYRFEFLNSLLQSKFLWDDPETKISCKNSVLQVE